MHKRNLINNNQPTIVPKRISEYNTLDSLQVQQPNKRIKLSSNRNELSSSMPSANQNSSKTIRNDDETVFQTVESTHGILGDDQLDELIKSNESLQNYVNRSFKKCLNKVDKSMMILLLKDKIKNGGFEMWDNTPLPLLAREKLKNLNLALNGNLMKQNESKFQNSKEVTNEKTENLRSINSEENSTILNHNKHQKLLKESKFENFPQKSEINSQKKQNKQLESEKNETQRNKKHLGNSNEQTFDESKRNQPKNSNKKNQFKSDISDKVYSKSYNTLDGPFESRSISRPESGDKPDIEIKSQINLNNSFSKFDVYSNFEIKKKSNQLTDAFIIKKNQENIMSKKSKQTNSDYVFNSFPTLSIKNSNPENCQNSARIVGTCLDLDKPYVRLTDHPNPSQIRPKHILEKSLTFIIGRYLNKLEDHFYVIDQFRSIRQVNSLGSSCSKY